MNEPRQTKRAILEAVRLYLVTDASPRVEPIEKFLSAAVAGGVGMVQLRDRTLDDARLFDVARRCSATCRALQVPFIVNDRVDIALGCGADGVHVGQDDLPVQTVRQLVGDQLLIGLSTHSEEQIKRAAYLDIDYIGVGPVHETPTKQGRPAVGLELVRFAAMHASQPFFAIGGLDPSNIANVVAAGATGVSVLRWISNSSDPCASARQIVDEFKRARHALASL